jgi:hypothetical protein
VGTPHRCARDHRVRRPADATIDALRLHGEGPGLANVHDPYQRVAFSASPLDVADVWVDGVARVRAGRITAGDPKAWVRASRPLAAELVTRAGLHDLSVMAMTRPGGDE